MQVLVNTHSGTMHHMLTTGVNDCKDTNKFELQWQYDMWRRLSENMQLSSTWLDGSRATARSVHEAIPLFVLNRPPGTSARRAFSLTELTTTRIPSLTCLLVSIIWRYFFSPEIGKLNDSVCAGPSGRVTPKLAAHLCPQIRAVNSPLEPLSNKLQESRLYSLFWSHLRRNGGLIPKVRHSHVGGRRNTTNGSDLE